MGVGILSIYHSWAHDHLAKKQVHINKMLYPSPVYREMEPLERRILFINQSVEKGQGKGGGPSFFSPLLLSLLLKARCPQ